MKRIIFVTDFFYPSSFAASTRIQPLYTKVKESQQFDIRVYTDKISKGQENVIVNLFSSPNSTKGLFRRTVQEVLLGLELCLKLVFVKADFIIITSPPFITSVLAAFGCVMSNKKYCFDVRDIYPDVYIKANLIKETNILTRILLLLEKFCYKHASFITTVSPALTREINFKSGSTKCVLLPNGFSEKVFSLTNSSMETFTVVFHGNIGRFQNIELVIDVANLIMKKQANIKFIVIGDGPKDTYLKKYKPFNLDYLGRLSNKEVADIISKCHLGVSFRTDDIISINATPVKVYEYIGVGLPILITPFESEGALLVEDLGIGVRFRNDEPEKIAQMIISMASNKIFYTTFKDNIAKIREDFSREKQAAQFLYILEKTVC